MVISKYVPLLVPRIKAETSTVATAEFTPLPEQTVRVPLMPRPCQPNKREGGVRHAILGLVMGHMGDITRQASLDDRQDAARSNEQLTPVDDHPGE